MNSLPYILAKIILDYAYKYDECEIFYVSSSLGINGLIDNDNSDIKPIYNKLKKIYDAKNKIQKFSHPLDNVPYITLKSGLYYIDKKKKVSHSILMLNRHYTFNFNTLHKIKKNLNEQIGIICINKNETSWWGESKNIYDLDSKLIEGNKNNLNFKQLKNKITEYFMDFVENTIFNTYRKKKKR